MVNSRFSAIFNGILEAWNLIENPKNYAKMRGQKIEAPAVYHAGINHAAPPCGLYHSLVAAAGT
jgi:hypothetical protein